MSQSIVYTGPLAAVETPDGTVFTKGVPVTVAPELAAALLLQSFAEVTSNGDVGALPGVPSVAPAIAAASASPVPQAAPVPDVTATPTDTGVPAAPPQPATSFTADPAVDVAPADPASAPADTAPAQAPAVLAPVSGVTS